MRIGIVTSDVDSPLVRRASDALGEETHAIDDTAQSILDTNPSVVVALGKSAVIDLVRAGVSVPVLAVDAGQELESVPADDLERAIDTLLSGEWRTGERPLLSVSVAGERVADALFDATLVTSEPARISEYGIQADNDAIAQFRADAVVVATPVGSRGYARDAGGPVVQSGTGVLAVVPVAPFAIHVDDWVLPSPVTLSVERDEDAVVLLADDREVRSVEPHEPVRIASDGEVELVSVPASQGFFEQ